MNRHEGKFIAKKKGEVRDNNGNYTSEYVKHLEDSISLWRKQQEGFEILNKDIAKSIIKGKYREHDGIELIAYPSLVEEIFSEFGEVKGDRENNGIDMDWCKTVTISGITLAIAGSAYYGGQLEVYLCDSFYEEVGNPTIEEMLKNPESAFDGFTEWYDEYIRVL